MHSPILYKNAFSCELKDVDKSKRTMMGAFTRYNVVDSDKDRGKRGMFVKTWSENFARIKHLLNHDVTKPVGKIKRLWDDEDYAYYDSAVGTHKLGDDVLEMADSGLLTEHSYGYSTVKQQKASDGINELLEVKQWELSILTGWGANEHTPLLAFTKAMDKEGLSKKLAERMKALDKFCRNSNASDETIELLLLEIKQLQQHILDLTEKSTHAVVETPEPPKEEKKEDLNSDEILSLIQLKKSLLNH